MPRTIPEHRFPDLIAAATRVFISQGFRRTQMADVAAEMGVAKGTLYLYVESKDALFDAVLRHADQPVLAPEELPLPTPKPGSTLAMVGARVARGGSLSQLAEALERRRVSDARAELEGIVRELYQTLYQNRTGIKLLDRCAADHPELAALWFRGGREGALELLTRYLEDRIRKRHLRPVHDAAITACIALETIVFSAVHRHWDPSPQLIDDKAAEDAAVTFVLRALLQED